MKVFIVLLAILHVSYSCRDEDIDDPMKKCQKFVEAVQLAFDGKSNETIEDYIRDPSYMRVCRNSYTMNRAETLALINSKRGWFSVSFTVDKAFNKHGGDLNCHITLEKFGFEMDAVYDMLPDNKLAGGFMIYRIIEICDNKRKMARMGFDPRDYYDVRRSC